MNQHIRDKIKKAGVKHWQVASCLGVSECTFVRWLRFSMDSEKEEMIMTAIEKAGEVYGK